MRNKSKLVICNECNEIISAKTKWCTKCNANHFEVDFSNWTSSSAAIDEFIRKTQLTAERHEFVFEWVDYSKFSRLRKVKFSINNEAYWEEGYVTSWNSELNKWNRSGGQWVKLVSHYCEKYLISHFLKSELEAAKADLSKRLIFGLTRDPVSKDYCVIEKLQELCPSCKREWMCSRWCRGCYSNLFEAERSNWTSGNSDIDDFIYETQVTAEFPEQVLEWIPETQFTKMIQIGQGGYGTVFKSYLKVGRIRKWNSNTNKWDRDEPMSVALKNIAEEENSVTEFLKEIRALHECLKINLYSLDCYGITRHPETKKYLIVMRFVEEGDLRTYLSSNFSNSSWDNRLDRLWSFSIDLRSLHYAGLVHRDLHAGNMLFGKNGHISELTTDDQIDIKKQFRLAEEERKRNPFPVVPYSELKTHPLAIYTSRIVPRVTADVHTGTSQYDLRFDSS
ncbi:7377_t:CDS:2 [Acaulospora morrowiae]|uniref:7377_t:CDS:1 n=1 Tax=Acaulospora morrowiae TaxID=94023 RepID=A0A9N8WGB4_9GLOM|nr:7377_t:CDS:2 [Acaulospora morrowiae]